MKCRVSARSVSRVRRHDRRRLSVANPSHNEALGTTSSQRLATPDPYRVPRDQTGDRLEPTSGGVPQGSVWGTVRKRERVDENTVVHRYRGFHRVAGPSGRSVRAGSRTAPLHPASGDRGQPPSLSETSKPIIHPSELSTSSTSEITLSSSSDPMPSPRNGWLAAQLWIATKSSNARSPRSRRTRAVSRRNSSRRHRGHTRSADCSALSFAGDPPAMPKRLRIV